MKLRDYQSECLQACLNHIKSKKSKPALAIAPVAYGKSVVISELARVSGHKTIVLQPSVELLEQNFGKLIDLGGEATIYSASTGKKEISNLIYATLGSVSELGTELKGLGIDLVIIDEAHFGYSPEKTSEFSKFMSDLKPNHCIGFTASPWRLKSNGWGSELKLLTRMRPNYFKEFIYVMQIKDIIEQGHWSKFQYEEHLFDESELRLNSTGAEFTQDSIVMVNNTLGINNNIYLRVKGLIQVGYKSILVFCDSLETATKLHEYVPNSAVVSGKTNKKERKQIISDFKQGSINVVFNYSVLGTGFDFPELQVVIMGRPTNSLSIYYQYFGRVIRKHENKDKGLFIDFGNNVQRFGRIENLSVENFEDYGWGVFNGERLLTNTNLADFTVTKNTLRNKSKKIVSTGVWEFGKHKGKKLHEAGIPYITWMLEKSGFDFSSNKMRALKIQLQEIVDKEKQVLASCG